MTSRVADWWSIDLIRHCVAGFIAGAAVTAAIVAMGWSLSSGDTFKLEGNPDSAGDLIRMELLARQAGEALGLQSGVAAARAQLDDLIVNGNYDQGYDLAYAQAWNDAIDRLTRAAPLQSQAEREGTQWIELRR